MNAIQTVSSFQQLLVIAISVPILEHDESSYTCTPLIYVMNVSPYFFHLRHHWMRCSTTSLEWRWTPPTTRRREKAHSPHHGFLHIPVWSVCNQWGVSSLYCWAYLAIYQFLDRTEYNYHSDFLGTIPASVGLHISMMLETSGGLDENKNLLRTANAYWPVQRQEEQVTTQHDQRWKQINCSTEPFHNRTRLAWVCMIANTVTLWACDFSK